MKENEKEEDFPENIQLPLPGSLKTTEPNENEMTNFIQEEDEEEIENNDDEDELNILSEETEDLPIPNENEDEF